MVSPWANELMAAMAIVDNEAAIVSTLVHNAFSLVHNASGETFQNHKYNSPCKD